MKSISGHPLYIGSEVLPTPTPLGPMENAKMQTLTSILIIVKTYSNEPLINQYGV